MKAKNTNAKNLAFILILPDPAALRSYLSVIFYFGL
jgi:hypothetical protein